IEGLRRKRNLLIASQQLQRCRLDFEWAERVGLESRRVRHHRGVMTFALRARGHGGRILPFRRGGSGRAAWISKVSANLPAFLNPGSGHRSALRLERYGETDTADHRRIMGVPGAVGLWSVTCPDADGASNPHQPR